MHGFYSIEIIMDCSIKIYMIFTKCFYLRLHRLKGINLLEEIKQSEIPLIPLAKNLLLKMESLCCYYPPSAERERIVYIFRHD